MFNEQGQWWASLYAKPSPSTFFGHNPSSPPLNTVQTWSAKLADTIVDSELACHQQIARSVQERITKRKNRRDYLPVYGVRAGGSKERGPVPRACGNRFSKRKQIVMLALLRPYVICHAQGSNSQPHYDIDHYQSLHSLS